MPNNPEIQLDFVARRDGSNFRTRNRSEILRSQERARIKLEKVTNIERRIGTNIPDKSIVATLRIFGVSENKVMGRVIVIQKDPKTKKDVYWEYIKAEPGSLIAPPTTGVMISHWAMSGVHGIGPVIDVGKTFSDFDNILCRDTGFVTMAGGVVFEPQGEPRRIYKIAQEGFQYPRNGQIGLYRIAKPEQLRVLDPAALHRRLAS